MPKLLIILCLVLTGCETMNGLGMDMQRAGSNLSDKAAPAPKHPQVMAYPDDAEPE